MANHLPVPVELTDAELEMVSAGQNTATGNVVNVQLDNVLNNNNVLNNSLNNNKIVVDVL